MSIDPENGHAVPAATDQAIDRALGMLIHAEPSPDFHARLLDSLEARRASSPRPTARRPLAVSSPAWATHPRLLAIAASVVFSCAALFFWSHRHGSADVPASAHTLSGPGQPVSVPSEAATRSQAAQAGALVSAPVPAPSQAAPVPVFHLGITSAPPPAAGAVATANPLPTAEQLDAQAVADLHAPSQPAPPLPSTDQERAVALLLRHGEKHELAELDPERLQRRMAREQAAFSDFFDPPPPPESIAWELYRPPSTSGATGTAASNTSQTSPVRQTNSPGDSH